YNTPLISAAIDMAARNHTIAPKAIFHSDRGSNYQCRLVRPGVVRGCDVRGGLATGWLGCLLDYNS
ncbi:MAG: hypothetical protein WCG47_26650, partial [Dermatophilaceae bacterium]